MKKEEGSNFVLEAAPESEQLHQVQQQARAVPRRFSLVARVRWYVWRAWLWVLVRIARFTWKHWLLVATLVLLGVVAYLFNPVERSPNDGLNHDCGIGSAEFLPAIAGATDTPFRSGNKIETYSNGDEFYPP